MQTTAMQAFLHILGAVGGVVTPIVLGVVSLTLFFRFVGLVGRLFGTREADVVSLRIRGVLDDETRVKVRLLDGTIYEDVLLLGSLRSASGKGDYPIGLASMLVLEHQDGRRTLVREKHIKLVEAPAGPNKADGS